MPPVESERNDLPDFRQQSDQTGFTAVIVLSCSWNGYVVKVAGIGTSIVSQQDAKNLAIQAARDRLQKMSPCIFQEPSETFSNSQQSYTATCPAGFHGSPVSRTVDAGTFTSSISQEDADAQALASARSQALGDIDCEEDEITYASTQSYTATCPAGQTGDSVTRSATRTSLISQDDADNLALTDARELAESELVCTGTITPFTSIKSYTAFCPDGMVGNPVTTEIIATSLISQEDADNAAYISAKNTSEQALSCLWQSTQSYTATCPDGTVGNSVTRVRTEQSDVSQEDADTKALNSAKELAEESLDCAAVFKNTEQTANANCPSGRSGNEVTYTVAAGSFSSTISQDDADAQALSYAQQQANLQLVCWPACPAGPFTLTGSIQPDGGSPTAFTISLTGSGENGHCAYTGNFNVLDFDFSINLEIDQNWIGWILSFGNDANALELDDDGTYNPVGIYGDTSFDSGGGVYRLMALQID